MSSSPQPSFCVPFLYFDRLLTGSIRLTGDALEVSLELRLSDGTLESGEREIHFHREGEEIRFAAVFDQAGPVRALLSVAGEVVEEAHHELTPDAAWERVIFCAEGFISGDEAPPEEAWNDLPDPDSEPAEGETPYWDVVPAVRTRLPGIRAEIRHRGLVAKALRSLERSGGEAVPPAATVEGLIMGVWDGIAGDIMHVNAPLRLAGEDRDEAAIFMNYLSTPEQAGAELGDFLAAVVELGSQEALRDRVLEMAAVLSGTEDPEIFELGLADECEDPDYLGGYLTGYGAGYFCTQTGIVLFGAAGSHDGEVLASSLRAGKEAAQALLDRAAALFPEKIQMIGINDPAELGSIFQSQSKGVFCSFAGSVRSADELRSTRRTAALFRHDFQGEF